jgi:hypothetical protein
LKNMISVSPITKDTKTIEAMNMKVAKIEIGKAVPHPTLKIDFTVLSQTNKAIIRLIMGPRINATINRSAIEGFFLKLFYLQKARALTIHPISSGNKGLSHSIVSVHHKAFRFDI